MATEEAGRTATEIAPDEDVKNKTRHAPMYRVLVHNDNVTTMEFVVHILKSVFQKAEQDAVEIMFRAHNAGLAHVATLPLEQAEFRVDQSHSLARARKFPLKLTYERED